MAKEIYRAHGALDMLARILRIDRKRTDLADALDQNVRDLAATASLLETAGIQTLLPPPQLDAINQLVRDVGGIPETPEVKKARILGIEDPLQRYREMLSIVSTPTDEEREGLRTIGYAPFTIDQKSLGHFVAQDPSGKYFENRPFLLEHIKEITSVTDFEPPAQFTVYVPSNPDQIFIPNSNNLSQAEQAKRIDAFSKQEIEPNFPNARAIMLPITGILQIDWARYMREATKGQKLIVHGRARALEKLQNGHSGTVGRSGEGQLLVFFSSDEAGDKAIYALIALVFLKNPELVEG